MAIVVDTSVLIDNLRGRSEAQEALQRARAEGELLVSSVLCKIEVLAGLRRGEETATRALFGELEWQNVDDAVAERAGSLANRFARTHPGVEIVDYVVAATAESLGAELWTRNVRHFPMFAGLTAPY